MKNLFTAALVSLPLLAAAGTGMAVAATGNPHAIEMLPAAHSLAQHVGYFLPNGVYICTWQQVIVDYNAWGQPLFQAVCQ